MGYTKDRQEFWKRGHNINNRSSCILFHHLLDRLKKVASEIRCVTLHFLAERNVLNAECWTAMNAQINVFFIIVWSANWFVLHVLCHHCVYNCHHFNLGYTQLFSSYKYFLKPLQ